LGAGRACLPVGRLSLQAPQSFAVALKLWWLPAFTQAGAKAHWAFAPSLLMRHIACLPDRQNPRSAFRSIAGAAMRLCLR